MLMELTLSQRKKLDAALRRAFPSVEELRRMLKLELGWNLEEFTYGDLSNRVLQLVTRAEARGQLDELVAKAHRANPNNRQLKEICEELGLVEQAVEDSPEALRERTADLDALHEKTRQLLDWPQTLPKDRWIARPELAQLRQQIEGGDNSRIVLLGAPGSGKSALLARLGSELQEHEDVIVLGVKADRIPAKIDTAAAYQEWLGISTPLPSLVRQLARTKKVVLLVDQLDALADLIDVRTRRLDVMIEALEKLDKVEHLHVVVSSRTFEFKHDVRFRGYRSEAVHVELPAWSEIEPALREAGVETAGWSQKARELLRTPQHLKLFLQDLSESKEPFESYVHMLEAVWQKHVVDAQHPERAEFVAELAAVMTDEEELSLPVARFDSRREEILQLEADGILFTRDSRVGFAHQTLLEFARCRAFVSGKEHLVDFVLPRQDTLSVRPKLWTSLEYLRTVGGKTYVTEFDRLWNAPNLRTHVRGLMVEFLGQLADPTEDEKRWMRAELLKSDGREFALRAMIGSRGWFRWLAKQYLPSFMAEPAEQAWATVPVLARGWAMDREQVLDLIEKCWLNHTDKHPLVVRLFQQIDGWDDRAVDMLARVLRESPVSHYSVTDLAKRVSKQLPSLAPRVLVAALNRESAELAAEADEKKRREATRRLLNSHEWRRAPEIASSAPSEYLDALWPWFTDLLSRFQQQPHAFVTGYAQTSLVLRVSELEDEEGNEPSLLASMLKAIVGAAKQGAGSFLQFVESAKRIELLEVHQLLAKGLRYVAATHPREVLEYLLADARRLILGDYQDEHRDSIELIRAVVPALAPPDIVRLENAIKEWKSYFGSVPPAKGPDPLWRFKKERAHRLHLLRAIPMDKLLPEARKFVREEELALEEPSERARRKKKPAARPRRLIEARYIGSPMSAEEMEKAHEDDIFGLFAELTDATEWDHPRRRADFVGGSIEASRAFASFAVKQPERAQKIMVRFQSGHHERPVAYALRELAMRKHDPRQLSDWVVEFNQRGFSSREFRQWAADVLRYVADESSGLPDSLVEMLSSWLVDEETTEAADDQLDVTESGDSHVSSILLHPIGLSIVPDGNYPILRAVLQAYLKRSPPSMDQAFAVLEKHLTRGEKPPVWQMLSAELLPWLLWNVDVDRARAFLDTLLSKFPQVLQSNEGMCLLLKIRSRVPPERLRTWLESVRDGSWVHGPQAFGEFVAVLAALDGQSWAQQCVDDILSGRNDPPPRGDTMRLGVAITASALWDDPQGRSTATELLVRLIPSATDDVAKEIMATFDRVDALLDDCQTRQLLQAILAHPEVLRGGRQSLVERLGDMVSNEPELVAELCEAVVAQLEAQSKADMDPDLLINLALTLERQQWSRPRGLILFERMLRTRVLSFDASIALADSDGRRRNRYT